MKFESMVLKSIEIQFNFRIIYEKCSGTVLPLIMHYAHFKNTYASVDFVRKKKLIFNYSQTGQQQRHLHKCEIKKCQFW